MIEVAKDPTFWQYKALYYFLKIPKSVLKVAEGGVEIPRSKNVGSMAWHFVGKSL